MSCTCFFCSLLDWFDSNVGLIVLCYTIFKSVLLLFRQCGEATNLILDCRVSSLERDIKSIKETLSDDDDS